MSGSSRQPGGRSRKARGPRRGAFAARWRAAGGGDADCSSEHVLGGGRSRLDCAEEQRGLAWSVLGAPAGTSSQRAPRRLRKTAAKATRIRGLRAARLARWTVRGTAAGKMGRFTLSDYRRRIRLTRFRGVFDPARRSRSEWPSRCAWRPLERAQRLRRGSRDGGADNLARRRFRASGAATKTRERIRA
jgi:hypothetical protein